MDLRNGGSRSKIEDMSYREDGIQVGIFSLGDSLSSVKGDSVGAKRLANNH